MSLLFYQNSFSCNPYYLLIPFVASYMFWTDSEEGKLYRSYMDGTNIKIIQEGFSPIGITADFEGEDTYIT